MSSTKSGTEDYKTESGVEYEPHSMMHKAIIEMSPTKLEMLEGFERVSSGYKFVPEDSNVRVIITGRDWSEKRILIYGTESNAEARKYVNIIIKRVTEIGHSAELVSGPKITNIAVNGDFKNPLQLESITTDLASRGLSVEYEPEQFPAAIVELEHPSVTFLLFSTGKFGIQGLKQFDDIESSIEEMLRHLDVETS